MSEPSPVTTRAGLGAALSGRRTTTALGPVAVLIAFAGLAGVTVGQGLFNTVGWALLLLPLAFRNSLWPRTNRWNLPALAIAVVAFPFLARENPYWTHTAALTAIYVIAALGLNIQIGSAGIPNMAAAAVFGSGAYTAGMLATKLEWSAWATIPAGVVVTVLIGCLLYLPVLRTRGFYVALVTIAFGVVFTLVLNNTDELGGSQGISVPGLGGSFETPLTIGSFELPFYARYYFLMAALAALAYVIADRLSESRLGARWNALRDDEIATRCAGINIGWSMFGAFTVGNAFLGLAGALYAHHVGYVAPTEFTFADSLTLLSIVILGGLDSPRGMVLGSVLLIHLAETLRGIATYRFLIYGIVIVLVLLFAREGLLPARIREYRSAARGPLSRVLTRLGSTLAAPFHKAHVATGEGGLRLEVRDAVVAFGGLRALDGVNISVAPGEMLGVIGPNGSGKTTLFNAVFGLYPLASGQILFDGVDVSHLPTHERVRHGIDRTFQHNRVLGKQSVLDNVHVGQNELRVDEVQEWLEFFDTSLPGRLYDPAVDLTLIDRRRVEMARALFNQPRLLLLDEPTAGLSPAETSRAIEDVRRARDRLPGLTIVIVEHDMSVISGLCERVIVLSNGKVLTSGSFADVTMDAHVQEVYLGAEVPA